MTTTPEATPEVRRYRKKPVEVETLEWTGKNLDALRAFAGEENLRYLAGVEDETLDVWNDQELGWIPCPVGHSVVKGKLREFYPISPEAVAATYDPAEGPAEGEAAVREPAQAAVMPPSVTYFGPVRLELMGHRYREGHLSEVVIAGQPFLRLDPAGGAPEYYRPDAVYCLTPGTPAAAPRAAIPERFGELDVLDDDDDNEGGPSDGR